jgi:hypothetical protein
VDLASEEKAIHIVTVKAEPTRHFGTSQTTGHELDHDTRLVVVIKETAELGPKLACEQHDGLANLRGLHQTHRDVLDNVEGKEHNSDFVAAERDLIGKARESLIGHRCTRHQSPQPRWRLVQYAKKVLDEASRVEVIVGRERCRHRASFILGTKEASPAGEASGS